jgi:hypothetical protein
MRLSTSPSEAMDERRAVDSPSDSPRVGTMARVKDSGWMDSLSGTTATTLGTRDPFEAVEKNRKSWTR